MLNRTNKSAAILLSLAIAFTSFTAGCDAFLEEEPYTFLTRENFYRTEQDAVSAVNAAYDALHKGDLYRGDIFRLVDFPSAQSTDNLGGSPLDLLEWDETTGSIADLWEMSYNGIYRTHEVIENVPPIKMDGELKERLVAEARFIRGLHYFNLIRLFGNVPLVTSAANNITEFAPSNVDTHEAVWNLIIDDFQHAEQVLPEGYAGMDIGRATTWAAKAMLAKVYLQRSGLAKYAPDPSQWGVEGVDEWGLALQKSQEIIDSGPFELFEEYWKVFDVSTKNGQEHIFSIQFLAGIGKPEGGASIVKDIGVVGAGGQHPYGGDSDWTGHPEFFEMWDPADKRFEWTWVLGFEFEGEMHRYPGSDLMSTPHIYKYRIKPDEKERLERFSMNVPVVRYSDLLLMHSEAANESGQGDALMGISEVRERAGLAPLSGLSQEALRQAIIQEREFELCFEAKAFFDYQRQGILEERNAAVGLTNIEDFRYVYPIPQFELDRNPNIVQNPGY